MDRNTATSQYRCTRDELEKKLGAVREKTLGEVDTAHVFDITKTNPKVTGIAGDVIEQSVIGYPANSAQEPDLVVDGEEVELKTTGLRKSKRMRGLEAKEPMSITAVSLDGIASEDFDHSNFWHKVRYMLLVYYLYDSPRTVVAAEYARFPIKGYQFHHFSREERETLRNDWQLVHDFVKRIQDEHPDEEERKALYPQLSSALRDKLLLIDTAPKYPHPPRFRLKRSTVTAIARKSFGDSMVQLPRSYTSYSDIDATLRRVSGLYRNMTLADMAAALGVSGKVSKGMTERIVARAFGADVKRMADVELFAKAGIKAKSIVLTTSGNRTEDMKLFTIDFSELTDPAATFEQSSIRDYFSEGSMICVVLEEPSHRAPYPTNRFLGFKRVVFDDDFIDSEVRRTWNEIHSLICLHRLRLIPKLDKNGNQVINKTGVPSEAPNFPKAAGHDVFVRGTSTDSRRKPLEINGLRMYNQQLWIKGTYMADCLRETPWV